MGFSTEKEFEAKFVEMLTQYGWEEEVLYYPTEDELLANWAKILFENNRHKDKLGDCPLTQGEMRQILEQIATLKTPLALNGFINGKTVQIIRDNTEDTLHFGKTVSLKIYDRQEIARGQSRYQIVSQPRFKTKKILPDRRGDVMLLINGMPLIHVELKKSGIPLSQATNQLQKYMGEGIFTGFFSLVQVFVAMKPEETVYFANPGSADAFKKEFFFHWADFDNEPIDDWKKVVSSLLSIPLAHQLIGFYTVADKDDGVLKVMRSYQYFAASAISSRVAKHRWGEKDQRGGFIWHTTGSGKTLTSFKSAQLIALSQNADKVIFLMDRIELGTQSVQEYRAFSDASDAVQDTKNTHALISKLKSKNPSDTLIVTSIQKMSNISEGGAEGLTTDVIAEISEKRLVFILDECHRSTFGTMLQTIKETFPLALFFGFTGTPIQAENQKKQSTTMTIFGDELHRYSIADGIRDKNVLGFDPYMILTYRDKDVREAIALEKTKAQSLAEVTADKAKEAVYYKYMQEVPMAGKQNADGSYTKGIEDFLPVSQYERQVHHDKVIEDISEHFWLLSHNRKFHAILATSSIKEAIAYYRQMKKDFPNLTVTALFDPNIDNNGAGLEKEAGLVELIEDYNKHFGRDFTIQTFGTMKKDIAARLAHKTPYHHLELSEQIDILIVVDQMLTGFDSKWVNTLYLDKKMEYENIIQAFSRTNRLFGHEKPFGTIRYYRYPHTMKRNIEAAVKLYSGDKPLALFVDRLPENIDGINEKFLEIQRLFHEEAIEDYHTLPKSEVLCQKFAASFVALGRLLDAAKVQGFSWEQHIYEFADKKGKSYQKEVLLNPKTYLVWVLRYKELFQATDGEGREHEGEIPYELAGYLMEVDTEAIDAQYMCSRFEKYLKLLHQDEVDKIVLFQVEEELHHSFAMLTKEEQRYAELFLHDIQSGDVLPESNKSLQDYIQAYMVRAGNKNRQKLAESFGLEEAMLKSLEDASVTEENLNEYHRFSNLMDTMDKKKAKTYLETKMGQPVKLRDVIAYATPIVKKFVLTGKFED